MSAMRTEPEAIYQRIQHLYVLEIGRMVLEGAAAKLVGNRRVIDTCLGLSTWAQADRS
jgi:ABC-type branched-subunit amino acid transport system ATPase component